MELCEPECSVERAIGVVGGKWKLYLIRILLTAGPQRFNDLLAAVDGISPKVLTENLRDLEASGVVQHDRNGALLYELTASGRGLMPALQSLGAWHDRHEAEVASA